MKKKKTKPARSAKRFPRPAVMIVTAIAVVAIAAITVVSRQSDNSKQTNLPQPVMANAPEKKFTTVKAASQDVPVDSQNGQIKPLTPEEAKRLAASLKGMLNKSTEGLVEEHNHDGSVSLDLKDRFQHVVVARVNKDGTVSKSCVDNPRAAANFFGIDPKLLEPEQPTLQNQ